MKQEGAAKEFVPSVIRMVGPAESGSKELSELTQDWNDKTLLVGIGGSGGQLAIKVHEQHKMDSNIQICAVNSDSSEMRLMRHLGIPMLELKRAVPPVKKGEEGGAPMDMSMFNGQGAGGNPEEGKKMMLENAKAFLELFRRLEQELGGGSRFCRVVLMFGYGGGTGAGASQVIAEELKKLFPYLEIYAIVVTPLMAGSKARMDQIVQSIEPIEKYVKVFFPIDQEGLYRAYGEKSQEEASRNLYEVALRAVNAFLLTIGVPVEKNIDAADLANGLSKEKENKEPQGQCAVVGYVEGKVEGLPTIEALKEENDLIKLLYAAVPGAFMFLKNVEGACHCTIKVAWGEGVTPSMEDFDELGTRARELANVGPEDFTLQFGYGQSPLVEKGEYKFAVFFSQFKDKNAQTLSQRMKDYYEEWLKREKRKGAQKASGKVLGFNTYRKEEPVDVESSTNAKEEDGEALEASTKPINQPERGVELKGVEAQEHQPAIAEMARPAKGAVPLIVEEKSAPTERRRTKMAAAGMGTMSASRESGKPIQRQLDMSLPEEESNPAVVDPLAFNPKRVVESLTERQNEE